MQFKKVISLSKEEGPLSEIISASSYKIGYFTMKCIGSDSLNEDSLLIAINDDEFYFAVADGAGGHPKGAEASKVATDSILNFTKEKGSPNFIEIFNNLNLKVQDLKVGARTTLSLGYINKDCFSCHSVGDSEIVYWNSLGNEIYANIPHSEVGYLIQGGVLEQQESLDEPNRYLVTNLIGDKAIRIESTSNMDVKKGQTIIIGSDGLFDNIPHTELSEIIAKGSFEESFKKLVDICTEQKSEDWRKQDDTTFIVLRKYQ